MHSNLKYCGLIDAANRIERKKARQHSGVLTGTGAPYPELEKVILHPFP